MIVIYNDVGNQLHAPNKSKNQGRESSIANNFTECIAAICNNYGKSHQETRRRHQKHCQAPTITNKIEHNKRTKKKPPTFRAQPNQPQTNLLLPIKPALSTNQTNQYHPNLQPPNPNPLQPSPTPNGYATSKSRSSSASLCDSAISAARCASRSRIRASPQPAGCDHQTKIYELLW